MKKSATIKVVRAAVIAAVYVCLTLLFYPISFSISQVRVSEALTVLPLMFPEAIAGLTIGCFIANLFSGHILDIIFGTLATFVSAVITYIIGKKIKNVYLKYILGALPPVLVNAFVVPFTYLAVSELKEAYMFAVLSVGMGQAIAVYVLGTLLYFALSKISVVITAKGGASELGDGKNLNDAIAQAPDTAKTSGVTQKSDVTQTTNSHQGDDKK